MDLLIIFILIIIIVLLAVMITEEMIFYISISKSDNKNLHDEDFIESSDRDFEELMKYDGEKNTKIK